DAHAVKLSSADKWIVGWNRIIRGTGGMRRRRQAAGALVDIQAQDAGKKVFVDALAVRAGVIGVAFIAERYVEITIGPEVQVAGVMIAKIIRLTDQNHFRVRETLVRIAR